MIAVQVEVGRLGESLNYPSLYKGVFVSLGLKLHKNKGEGAETISDWNQPKPWVLSTVLKPMFSVRPPRENIMKSNCTIFIYTWM